MGRWIDRAVIAAATAFVLYMLFLSAFGSVPVACCLSFACCILLLISRSAQAKKNRISRYQAQALLERWSYGPDDDAAAQIESLLGGRPGEIVYLPKHPSASLSLNDVFSAWKAHRSAQQLILCAVCPADSRARTFAATLNKPFVEIIDAPKLISLIRRSDLQPPHAPRGKRLFLRIRENLTLLLSRRPWHRSMLNGLALMLMYLITGSAFYLALSLAALFIGGMSVRSRA